MDITEIFVPILWGFFSVFGIAVIGAGFYFGWIDKDPKSLVRWRGVKLACTGLSVVSLVLFVLSFDQLTRGNLRAGSREYALTLFLNVKSTVLFEKAVACARDDAKALCGVWKNIDAGLPIGLLSSRQRFEYHLITDWQRADLFPEELQKLLNRDLQEINDTMRLGSSRPYLDGDNQLKVAMLAAILLIFAAAGNVGEAAFQFQQSRRAP